MAFVWIEVLTIALSFALAVTCLTRGKWRPSHRYLIQACFSAAVYESSQIGYQTAHDPAVKLLWVRLGFSAAFLLIPVLINLPCAVIPHTEPPRPMQWLAWGSALALIPMAWTDAMFYNDPKTGLVGKLGDLFVVCLPMFFLGTGHFIGTLLRALDRIQDDAICNRVAWMLLAMTGYCICITPDLLRRAGIVDLFGRPVAAVGVMFFMSCTSYAVLRHRLMDVELAISRGIAYSCLVPLLAGIFIATGEVLENVTQQLISSSSLTGSILAAMVVAMFFEPAKKTLERRVDYYFIRDDEIVKKLRELERAPALFVAEDLTELRRLQGDLAVLIQHLETRQIVDASERLGRG